MCWHKYGSWAVTGSYSVYNVLSNGARYEAGHYEVHVRTCARCNKSKTRRVRV